ncbi:arylsulfatase [Haloferula chungangensis]|uniref:Arylsulfatase n=1 Tax=Haloferula chungangensis TaxID=1048331 RepID=A0ABW2L8Q3_9BACT
MKNRITLLVALLLTPVAGLVAGADQEKPNIIYILADDLGYGDVHALNPERGKIATPHMDRLRAEGMTFTDCHTNSSVCTPTRYGIMTGRYAWRTKLQRGVLNGMSPPMIESERLTVGELLQQHGYTTAIIGKWHMGMNFDTDDYTKPITDGPLQHGFDYYFGISASLDMPPYVYIENDYFTAVPSEQKKFPSFIYGKVARTGPVREGPAAADFEAVKVLPELARRTVDYIGKHAQGTKPFFLYLALPSPHTPVVPSQEWKGKSELGPYGDFVMQTDGLVGEVLKAVDENGLEKNTIVVMTSDNGCAAYIGVGQLEELGHFPSAQFRGYKTQLWEGGHRVPFLVRWPAKVKAGSESDELICVTDLLATCAQLVGAKLPDDAGEDSVSFLPALLGDEMESQRDALVHHSYHGEFAIRQDKWKLLLCQGSGGATTGETDEKSAIQLYDLSRDISETTNLAEAHPEVVAALRKQLDKIVNHGRSTPGAKQENEVPVQIVKPEDKKRK